MSERPFLYIARSATGCWELRRQDGPVLGQYASISDALEAGRAAAAANGIDLVIQRSEESHRREAYDSRTGKLTPSGNVHLLHRETNAATERRQLILLVEDMLDARELYAEYLTYAGFSVVTAINGHEALGLARLLRPDLILMDIRLPGMDGLEATADIKADPATAQIPIVAITADSSPELRERAMLAGCTDLITKPVLPDEVGRRITDLLATSDSSRPSR